MRFSGLGTKLQKTPICHPCFKFLEIEFLQISRRIACNISRRRHLRRCRSVGRIFFCGCSLSFRKLQCR